MAHNYCKCWGNRGSCIDCAEEEIDHLTAQLAEANNKIAGLEEMYSELYQHHVEEKHSGELCEIETLHTQLAERDAEITRLQQQSVGWDAVFDENAALREEVERLKLIISGKTFVDERQLVAQEIIQYIIDQGKVAFGSLSARDYVYDIIDSDIEELRQRYGLEG